MRLFKHVSVLSALLLASCVAPALAQTKIELSTQVKGVLPSANGGMTSAEKAKLTGIATGATVNSPDATLLNRTNHTGAQPISTVTGLQTALDAKLDDSQATAFGLSQLDDANAAAGRATLALGTAATSATGDFEAAGAVAAHAAAGDPHSVYLTSAEGNATYAAVGHVGSGGTAHSNAVAAGVAGFMTGADKSKLDAISGTNTGDQIAISGNAGSATVLQTGRAISITGDMAYTSPSFNGSGNVTAAGTLATVNANVGTFGSSVLVPVVTVNAKGLVTAITTQSINSLSDGDKGDVTVSASGATWTIDAGAVSNADLANMPTATFKGRITAATGQPEDLSGTQATALLDVATGAAKGLMSFTDKTKLDGVAAGATANSSDATLRDRATHTGAQAISTVTGLQAAIDGKQPVATVLTDTTASFTTAQQTKLSGIATGATANSADAFLLARANHTGTVTSANISDFNAVARAQTEAELVAGTNITITPSGTGATRQLTLSASGGGVDPWTWTKLSADSTVSTVTFANVAGMSFSGTANTTYLVELVGAYQTAAVTTGIGLAFDIPADAEIIGINFVATTATSLGGTEQIADAATTGATTGVRAVTTNTPIVASWVIRFNATSGTAQLTQRSEIAASNTVLKANLTAMGRRVI